MTPQQKAIVKKLGGVPKVKGSAMWKRFHEPETVKKEHSETIKRMASHVSKEPSDNEKHSYQHRIGRAYSE